MSWAIFLRKFDWWLWGLAAGMLALSIVSFYGPGAKAQQIFHKQIIFSVLGLGLMLAAARLDYRIFKNYSAAASAGYILTVILLLVVLAFPPVRRAHSWIILYGYGFQPTEFAKLALVVLLAKYFSQKHVQIYRWRHLLASGLYAALPAGLTLLQPDFGSMMIFVALWLALLFFSGIKRRHLLTILMLGLIGLALAWFLLFKPYQKDRIVAFINPYLDPRGIGYNVIQAQTTFGSGQVWGTWWRQPAPAVLVPEQYTDFAFAAYGQKFGLAGVVLLVGLLAALLTRIGAAVTRTANNFAKLYGLGLATLIAIHTFMNAGMNLGILPITGIPFSFLSYGGSHLLTVMAGLGLVESIRIRG